MWGPVRYKYGGPDPYCLSVTFCCFTMPFCECPCKIVLPHLSKLPSTSLLRELHWLPVHSSYKLACLTYNSLSTGQPGYLRSLINYYTPTRTLRSTKQLLLDCPRFSTEFGKRSFSYLAPTVLNDLPLDTRLSPTADTFKRLSRQSSSHSLPVLPT